MPRPRLCYVCAAPAAIAAQQENTITVIDLDGNVRRHKQWQSRYLCDEHSDVEPWDLD